LGSLVFQEERIERGREREERGYIYGR
jgi:hypothetical protein